MIREKSLCTLCLEPEELFDETLFSSNILQYADVVELTLKSIEQSLLLQGCFDKLLALIEGRKLLIRSFGFIDPIFFLKKNNIIPWMIDLPYEGDYRANIQILRQEFPLVKIQLSYHSQPFQAALGDMVNIEQLFLDMQEYSIDAMKCALYPIDLDHALDSILWAKKHEGRFYNIPITLVLMGDTYSFSRVLLYFYKNFFTYTARVGCEKAPGQIDIQTLFRKYQIHEIEALDCFYALIGSPVSKSLSHLTHTRMLQIVFEKKSAIYLKIELPLESFSQTIWNKLLTLGIAGVSITTPLKERVAQFFSQDVIRLMPINTVRVLENRAVITANTDVLALYMYCIELFEKKSILRIALFGYGAVTKALAQFFCEKKASIDIYTTSENRKELNTGYRIRPYESYNQEIDQYSIIVNTTPLTASSDLLKLFPPDSIDGEVVVFEYLYPEKSLWLQEIERNKKAAKIITGVNLWLRQAALQFQFWKEGTCDLKNVFLYEDILENLLQNREIDEE